MATDPFERIEHIFGEVCDLPVEARDAKLDELCKEDLDLRQEVERLLVHHDSDNHLLDQVALNEVAAVVYQRELGEKLEKTPEKVGDYRIVEKIGEGGMSMVYRAKPEGEEGDRDVAVKVLKLGASREEFLQRFYYEHRSLANMKHPYIAHVYDAGALEDGRPYFAMEFIEGVPITEYCERKRLDLRARLDLFLSVCDGVLHAHRRGVLHRDLKPSNILVTEESGRPLPKLIDFGIAKAISDPGHRHTLVGMMMGTPAYMSPEQASNSDQVDTAVDVYGLGIVLYELMAGSLPLANEQYKVANQVEIVKMLEDNEWPRPSVRLTNNARRASIARSFGFDGEDQLVSALEPELDWIVLRAIAKDRTERYNSIAELVADIRNYLEQRPIMARKPTLGYQMRKFMARHRMPVAFTAAIVLLVVFSITGLSYLLVENQKARAQAERGFEELDGLLRSLDPRYNEPQELRIFFTNFSERLRARPEDVYRAKLHRLLGDLMFTHNGMEDLAITEFDQAISIFKNLNEDNVELYDSLFKTILIRQDDTDYAIRSMLHLTEQIPDGQDYYRLRIAINTSLSHLYIDAGQMDKSLQAVEEAKVILDEHFKGQDDYVKYVLEQLASSYLEAFEYDKGIALIEPLMNFDERDPYNIYNVGIAKRIANLHIYRGDWPAAEKANDLALEIESRSFGGNTKFLANILGSKATLMVETGDRQSVQFIEEYTPFVETAMGLNDAWSLSMYNKLARAHLAEGDIDSAIYAKRIEESRRPCSDYPDFVSEQTWVEIYLADDQLERALTSAVEAYLDITHSSRPHPFEVARSQWLIGKVMLSTGEYSKALTWLEDSWSVFVAEDHQWKFLVRSDLDRCYQQLGSSAFIFSNIEEVP